MKKNYLFSAVALSLFVAGFVPGCGSSSNSSASSVSSSAVSATEAQEAVTTETPESVSLVDAVKEAISGGIGEGESIDSVELSGRDLKIVCSGVVETNGIPAADIAYARISSITDPILELSDDYYSQWDTITIEFTGIGTATLDKSMVVDDPQVGKYFDGYDESIIKPE